MKQVLKYLLTFSCTLFILFLLLLITYRIIPFSAIRSNVSASIYQLKYDGGERIYAEKYDKRDIGDNVVIFSNFFADENKPLKSLIENAYFIHGQYLPENREAMNKKEYSRYWTGMAIYARILLLFTDYTGIQVVNLLIIGALSIILCLKISKKSKTLALSFALAMIILSFQNASIMIQYSTSIILGSIVSLFVIKEYNSGKNRFDYIYLILGVLTGFFDMLTAETLCLTMPLFIHLFYSIMDKKKVSFKEVFKYCLLWGLAYIGTFLIKWIICLIYYGFDYIHFLWYRGSQRVVSETVNYSNIFSLLIGMSELFYPFNFIPFGKYLVLIFITFGLLNIIFSLDKKKYFNLIFVALIPIIRFMVIRNNSEMLYFMTFRALFPTIVLLLYCSIIQINNLILPKKKKK
jgi:hypothetical protein